MEETKERISGVMAIKRFFEADGGYQVTLTELKALNSVERAELGQLAAKELGVELMTQLPK